ncbi:MAG: efflux RND transporter periplasmic adaptor subunit [Firmicutes bacterium]|nr:efflux RND transporter periplasmic adaptor subunit [Bacillota bacterium]
MGRKVIWIIVIVLIIGIGYRVITRKENVDKKMRDVGEGLVPVAIQEVKSGDLELILSFVGDIKGEDQVTVYSEATGRLSRYLVEEGNWVKKDQVIALVDRAVTGMEFEEARVKSPLSGTVGRLYLDKGSTIGLETPVALIARMDRVKVEFSIPEKDMVKVSKGQQARVRVDAYPDRTFNGKVTRLSPVVDPITRSAYAEVTLSNPDHKLKPGMFAEIDIVVVSSKGAVVIPKEAILEDLNSKSSFVFVVEGGSAVRRSVEKGISQQGLVEVKSGLSFGEKMIITGQHYLEDGDRVEVVQE